MASPSSADHAAPSLAPLLAELQRLQAAIERECGQRHKYKPQSGPPGTGLLTVYDRALLLVGEAASKAGFPGVLDICLLFKDCLQALADSAAGLDKAAQDELARWPQLLAAYLAAPTRAACRQALVAHLHYAAWGDALPADEAELLSSMLGMGSGVTGEAEGAPALPDDLSAKPADDLANDQANNQPPDEMADDDLLDSGAAAPPLDITISDAAPAALKEALAIMAVELLAIHEAVQQLAIAQQTEQAAAQRLAPGLTAQLRRYAAALGSLELDGLAEVVGHICANIESLPAAEPSVWADAISLLSVWPKILLACLKNPADAAAADALLAHMQQRAWPAPLAAESAATLRSRLMQHGLAAQEQAAPRRPQTASDADVSLQLPDDVGQDLLDALLAELPGQTEEFSAAISRLVAGGGLDDAQTAKRIAHTLKGAANTVGIRGIATLTHHLEDLMLILSRQADSPPAPIAATLMNAADCLAAMSEAMLGLGAPPPDARHTLQEVLDLVNLIEQQGMAAAAAQAEKTQHEGRPASAAAGHLQTGADEGIGNDEGKDSGKDNGNDGGNGIDKEGGRRTTAGAMMRLPSAFVDNLLRLAGEAIIMTGQVHDRVQLTQAKIKAMREQFEQLRQLGGQLEQIVDIKDLTALQSAPDVPSDYDSLEMDRYSELHSCCRRLVEAAVDANEEARAVAENLARLDDMLLAQARLNNETQEGVMRARMAPVRSQFARLQRSVRQAARLTGKEARLHLRGGDTLIDTDTLTRLLDPLMHLLRNAVDHGIEERAARQAAGKPAEGNISLEFRREGNQVVVLCRDDGRGLDHAAINRRAIEQGLCAAGDALSDEDIRALILRPDFSTSRAATQVSGRGIGMDVAHAAIMRLSGSLNLESAAGKGCTMEISLPQTLVSSYVLLAKAGPQRIAIANRGILQIVHHEAGRLLEYGGKPLFQADERSYPAWQFEQLIGMGFDRHAGQRVPRAALLVENEQGKHAVMVEQVSGGQDLVIKGLGHYVPRLPGVLGLTILGDGSVTPVVDLPELVRMAGAAGRYTKAEDRIKAGAGDKTAAGPPSALVVDDSLSARRSLAQFMQDAGYAVRMARDGVEAFAIIQASKPDIVLSDLEMPRMSGLELVGQIRADSSIAHIPCVMITSRTAARHQQAAMTAGVDAYLTKPYSEDELLQTIKSLRRG